MDPDPLDPVWKALANPVRRRILDLVRDEALTTGDLNEAFPELSRYAVMQHLDVLEDARLIVVKRVGRQRYNSLNAVPIREIYERWVRRYEGHWASALLALRDSLEDEAGVREGGPAKKKRPTKKTSRTRARTPNEPATGRRGGSGGSRRHRKDERNG